MVKFHNKTILGLAILVMLATSPMSISYTFAESSDEFEQKTTKSPKMTSIITEKVVDGKLEVKRFALPEDMSKEEMKNMIPFEEEISGWGYVNHKTYQSGIILYDGKVIKIGENQWEVSEEMLDSRDYTYVKDEEFSFRVIFSGKVTEAGSETFAVIFTNPNLKAPSNNIVNLFQITENTINDNQTHSKPLNSFLVV